MFGKTVYSGKGMKLMVEIQEYLRNKTEESGIGGA